MGKASKLECIGGKSTEEDERQSSESESEPSSFDSPADDTSDGELSTGPVNSGDLTSAPSASSVLPGSPMESSDTVMESARLEAATIAMMNELEERSAVHDDPFHTSVECKY